VALQILNTSQFAGVVLPQFWRTYLGTSQDPANGRWYTSGADGSSAGLYGALSDYLDQQPTFDTAHAKYVPQTSVGSTGIVDNRNGLNSIANTLSLNYSYQTGHTASHSTTAAISVGETAKFTVSFPGVGGVEADFSITDTFSYTDGTSDSTIETATQAVAVPVQVPAGKVYQAAIVFTQETLTVPYSMSVHATGYSETWFESPVQGHYNWQAYTPFIFDYVRANGVAGSDSPKYSSNGGEGLLTLTGEATMARSGGFQSKIYDVTSQYTSTGSGEAVLLETRTGLAASEAALTPSGTPLAASGTALAAPGATEQEAGGPGNAAGGVGVWHIMGHAGGTYVATVNDDLIEGGDGDDRIFVRGGGDIVFAGGGDDYIEAFGGGGKDVLHGQAGNDHILVVSDGELNELDGGAGDDLLQAYAPLSVLRGGEGDDYFVLDERGSGSRIVDTEGSNSLLVLSDVDLRYHRNGDDLFIHFDQDLRYQPREDIVWLNFFRQDGNSVNGLGTAEITAALPPEPEAPDPGGPPVPGTVMDLAAFA